ncbi:MAG: adenylate/guanylate cyclase domain-containing protein, partial [Acidimicrobiales bacterium]
AAMVGVSIISLLIITVIGLVTGRDLGRDLDQRRLRAMQSSGASDVASHMGNLQRSASALSASPQAEIALQAFADAHAELLDQDANSLGSKSQDLADDYRERYLEPLASIRPEIELRDVIPDNPAATHLQFHYVVDIGDGIAPDSVDDSGDGTEWSQVHAAVHPVYRNVVDRLGLADLYLLEPEQGFVVYSVRKRPDLGTSLGAGPFSGTGLSAAIDQIRSDSGPTRVTTDLGFYLPADDAPVGFVASRVTDGDRLVGYLVLMYDTEPLDNLLSAGGDWEAAGFPPTAQTMLFGGDGKVRSEPRSFVEDPSAHLAASVEAGLTEEDRDEIAAAGTTVLIQAVPATTVAAAELDDGSLLEQEVLTGAPGLLVAGPVPLDELDWFVLADVEVEAAERGVDDFAALLLVGVAVLILLLAFIAAAWSSRLVKPVRQISDQLGSQGDGRVDVDVPASSPAEFHELATSFETMANRIVDQREQVAATRRERLGLLRKMLPPAIAERVAAGRVQSIDEVLQASVVVVVVAGLGDLVRSEGNGVNRDVLNELLAELDDLAAGQQLDRIKVVGDAYFAACGHDRPLIDHAPRTVTFAVNARDAIRAIGRDRAADLDVVIGVHTGPVMAGMTGGGRSVYDVWGETVTTAHYLARRGDRGSIVISDQTRTLLPETVEVSPAQASDDDSSIWSVEAEPVRGQR